MRYLLLTIALTACGSSGPRSGVSSTVVGAQGAPAFTPPRPLPDDLAASGQRCARGDGAAFGEVIGALVNRRVPCALIDPWAQRGCSLRDPASCAALGDHAFQVFLRWHELPFDVLAPPEYLTTALGVCEGGDWKTCARLASVFGLSECRAARIISTYGEVEGDPELTRRVLAKAQPAARAACDTGESAACKWLGAMAAGECGYGRDLRLAEALFGNALANKPGVELCRKGDGIACDGLFRDYLAFENALTVTPEADADPVALPIANAHASSVLPSWKGYRFDVGQLLDGDLTTSWQPLDKRHGGVGQWVELAFSEPRLVSAIQVANGFQRRDALGDLFLLNGRVWRFRLEFSDQSMVHVDLDKTTRGRVTIAFPPRVVRSVRLVVGASWPGEKWKDLAISEIALLGNRAIPTPVAASLPAPCALPSSVAKAPCAAGDWKACHQHFAYARGGERRAAELLAIATGEKLCGTPEHAEVCRDTAGLLVRLEGPSAKSNALVNRACSLGVYGACGELGCHGDIVGGSYPSVDYKPEPGVCEQGCKAGDTFSCIALDEARHPGYLTDLAHPENKRLRARLRTCTDLASCLAQAEELEALDGREFASDPLASLRQIGAAELACEGGSARACAILALVARDHPIGEAAQKRACELDPGPCGNEAASAEPDVDVAALVARCSRHEARACDDLCEALEVTYDSEPSDLEWTTPHAQPALGMTAGLLQTMCIEYHLFALPI
jgi:hypothetical protein